jgi:hypothetical protein
MSSGNETTGAKAKAGLQEQSNKPTEEPKDG